LAGRAAGIPQLAESATLSIGAPAWLRSAAREASILTIEQPWQFQWARRMRGTLTKIVYNAQNVEADMFAVDRMRLPRSVAERLYASLRRQERDAVRGADCVFATSADDARKLSGRYGVAPEKIHVVPNGVDSSQIRPCTPSERSRSKADLGLAGRDVILFCGAKHQPNRQAVDAIVGWAKRWSDRPVQFVIVGSVAAWFTNVRLPNVTFTGFVTDLRPYYRAADVTVNPMTAGGGTNLKQLEYLASGVPSVTTVAGARGLPIQDGRDALVRELGAMPAAAEQLLTDAGLRARIGGGGRALAVREFDWASIGNHVVSIYRSL
jgi:glycosyltransferase involved in cell wall biosynthesis